MIIRGWGAGCEGDGWLLTSSGLGIFAVAGGPIDTLPVGLGAGLGVFGAAGFFGFGGAPPYFSRSSCVELYFVAAFSFSIVFVLSAC